MRAMNDALVTLRRIAGRNEGRTLSGAPGISRGGLEEAKEPHNRTTGFEGKLVASVPPAY